MKKMTPTQATERLAAMIEPKPEPAGRMQILSHKLVWHWYPEIMTANGPRYGDWQADDFDPLRDMNAAIRCVEAAGYRAAIGFVEHTQNTGEACVAMRSNVHYRTYYEYNDGNHALAICLALLHALEGEPVEIVDEGEVTP
jgi:hypothetical protein